MHAPASPDRNVSWRMPSRRIFIALVSAAAIAGLLARPEAQQQRAAATSVVVITIDGLRWQEMFGGADRSYFKKEKPDEVTGAERRFWRDSAGARRELL